MDVDIKLRFGILREFFRIVDRLAVKNTLRITYICNFDIASTLY